MTDKRINFYFMNILLAIYCIELVFPPITVLFNSTLIRLICLFGWLFISAITYARYYTHISFPMLVVFVFAIHVVVYPYIMGVGVIGNRYLSLSFIPISYIIFQYYKCFDKLRDLSIIIKISMIFAMITFFRTLKALIENPHISRSIKSSGEYSQSLAAAGIGGYSFVYFMVCMGVLFLYICLCDKRTYVKILSILAYLATIYFAVSSNYMTAFVVIFLSSGVLLFQQYSNKNRLLLFFLLICCVILLLNLNEILDSLSEFIPNRIARVILVDSNESIAESIWDEFEGDRWPTMKTSLDSFLHNPIFGIIPTNLLGYSNGYLTGFGQHSHILDTFALYGAVVGLLNLYVIFLPCFSKYGRNIRYGKSINVAMFVTIIGICLFNNVTESIALAIGIIFPLLREKYCTTTINAKINCECRT